MTFDGDGESALSVILLIIGLLVCSLLLAFALRYIGPRAEQSRPLSRAAVLVVAAIALVEVVAGVTIFGWKVTLGAALLMASMYVGRDWVRARTWRS